MARNNHLGLVINDEEKAKIIEIAKNEDRTHSQVVRRAINEYYENHKNN